MFTVDPPPESKNPGYGTAYLNYRKADLNYKNE